MTRLRTSTFSAPVFAAVALLLGACGSSPTASVTTSAAPSAASAAVSPSTATTATTIPTATTTATAAGGPIVSRTLSVSGVGTSDVVPDRVTISFGLVVSNPSASVAMQAATSDSESLVAYLEQRGITTGDIQTASVWLNAIYSPNYSGSPPPVVGYTATIGVTARAGDIGSVGPLVQGAIDDIGEHLVVQGLTWSSSNTHAALSAARSAAFADARARATELAALAGLTVGEVRQIAETPVSASYYAMEGGQGGGGGGYQPGTQTVTVSVTVEFALV